jgi:hypothetical protein
MGERIRENMRQIAAQSPAQLATGLVLIVGILAVMTAVGLIPLAALIGGTLGFVAVQAYARIRYRRP